MKLSLLRRGAALLALAALGAAMLACAELKEGEADMPARFTRGLQGGGQLGSSPSGEFEPR